jgi:hypothetical protein
MSYGVMCGDTDQMFWTCAVDLLTALDQNKPSLGIVS